MPFGLTYASFVFGIGLSMFLGPADPTAPQAQDSLSLGTAVTPGVDFGSENLLTFTRRSDQMVWGKFHPIYAIGMSDQNTAFVSAGLGRRLDIWGVQVMPFTGPALYIDRNHNDILQFRTGFDITQDFGNKITLTGGYYHISNGQANEASADLDVAHLGFTILF